MRRARKGSNRPRTERPGRGGGSSSDDYGRSTHPEVAPSHGRPAREHRVGLRPDDERAHGARATGAARAIARARISSVPTTTSAGESNTRETISTSAREKLSHEAKLSPTRPLRPPSPPEAGARWDGAARDSSAGPHVGRRARRDRVRGDSAQLGAPVLGGDGVVERQDEARSKARRDASAPRLRAPLPELPHHLRTRASFAFADAANPSPFLPPPSARRRRLIERLAGDSATTAAPGAGASRGASRGPTPPTPRDPVVALSAYEIDALERGSPRAEDSPTPRDSLGGAGDDDAGDKDSAFDQGWAGEEGALADRFRLLEDVRSTLGDMSDRYSVIFERMEDADSRREGGDGEGRSRRGERPSRNRA